jgi:mevalonate kinase
MQAPLFQTSTHAKCILAGEHAVLRGSPAVIFPVLQKHLIMTYAKSAELSIKFTTAPANSDLSTVFFNLLQTSANITQLPLSTFTGDFTLVNNIPIGSGMGFSSALCVTLAKWLHWKKFLASENIFNFARSLENNFHGKSSGVDIAGVLTDKGILYRLNHSIKKLQLAWRPLLFLSSSNSSSSTAKCISEVDKLWKENPTQGKKIDQEMQQSVCWITKALGLDPEAGFFLLADAMQKACRCFHQWHLITPTLQKHMNFLLDQGATAVKPTGSGAGGHVISLWQQPPKLAIEMIPVL